ncbi:MAG: HAD family hydrolase [Aerococcaceae bacterium]|nr:HAD family hydrolase [Aerococcaceae bacterium]
MRIEHLFCDMDGTLLRSDGTLSERNQRTILACAIPFTLVSARSPMEMTATMRQLNLTGPQVAYNGGLIFQLDGTILKESAMDTQTAYKVLDILAREFSEMSVHYYDRDTWYTDRLDDGTRLEMQATGLTPVWSDYVTFCQNKTHRVFKIMLIGFDSERLSQAKKRLDALNLGIHVHQSTSTYMEITAADATKAKGIEWILTQNGMSVSNAAAFGDGYNDVPMLSYVHHSVAMGNAPQDIQALCRYITATNNEDGVAQWMENYLLNCEEEK